MSRKRIGILTGGGDVPGLNSVIKTVVYRSSEIGCDVIGLRRGWEALTHVNLDDEASRTRYIQPLNRDNTRTNPPKMKKFPPYLAGKEFPKSESTKNGVTSVTYDVTAQVLGNLQAL